MLLYLISFLFLFQDIEVPFRAKDDFQIELKYEFKQRPAQDNTHVSLDPNGADERKSGGPLPYLLVHVKILNHKEEEVRFRCEDNLGKSQFNKKAEKTLTYTIDMGYVDDLKDRVTAHTYNLYAMTDSRKQLNRIELTVKEDGTFMVNGELRGKF
jgi:hypothetical protein